MFSLPVENVRPFVPEGFTIFGEGSGNALLNVGIATCPEMVVNGVERRGALAGFKAVFIEPYEGSGPQRYLLWLATSSGPLHQALRSLGLPSVHVRDMWMAMQEAVASVTAEGVVSKKGWRGG